MEPNYNQKFVVNISINGQNESLMTETAYTGRFTFEYKFNLKQEGEYSVQFYFADPYVILQSRLHKFSIKYYPEINIEKLGPKRSTMYSGENCTYNVTIIDYPPSEIFTIKYYIEGSDDIRQIDGVHTSEIDYMTSVNVSIPVPSMYGKYNVKIKIINSTNQVVKDEEFSFEKNDPLTSYQQTSTIPEKICKNAQIRVEYLIEGGDNPTFYYKFNNSRIYNNRMVKLTNEYGKQNEAWGYSDTAYHLGELQFGYGLFEDESNFTNKTVLVKDCNELFIDLSPRDWRNPLYYNIGFDVKCNHVPDTYVTIYAQVFGYNPYVVTSYHATNKTFYHSFYVPGYLFGIGNEYLIIYAINENNKITNIEYSRFQRPIDIYLGIEATPLTPLYNPGKTVLISTKVVNVKPNTKSS